jgi:hypothetical protein
VLPDNLGPRHRRPLTLLDPRIEVVTVEGRIADLATAGVSLDGLAQQDPAGIDAVEGHPLLDRVRQADETAVAHVGQRRADPQSGVGDPNKE